MHPSASCIVSCFILFNGVCSRRALVTLSAPHVIVERRHQDVTQLGLPMRHAFLFCNVLQRLGINGGRLHVVRLHGRDLRLEPVTVDAETHIGVCNEATIDSRAPTIVFVSLNVLQPIPRLFLRGKQRHLVVRPSVTAPLAATAIRFLHFIVRRQARIKRLAHVLRIAVRVFIARHMKHLLKILQLGNGGL